MYESQLVSNEPSSSIDTAVPLTKATSTAQRRLASPVMLDRITVDTFVRVTLSMLHGSTKFSTFTALDKALSPSHVWFHHNFFQSNATKCRINFT